MQSLHFRFSNLSNFRTHNKRIHNISNEEFGGAFKCPHCTRKFDKQTSVKRHIQAVHKDQSNLPKTASAMPPSDESPLLAENDPKILAENVRKQLEELQKAIEDENSQTNTEITSIDDAVVEEVYIKDRLNPLGQVTQYKIQRIKRADGFYYICEFCSVEFRKSWGYLR